MSSFIYSRPRHPGSQRAGSPGMHPMARIRKSRALTAHLIHAKTEQMLHLLLESGTHSIREMQWENGPVFWYT